jgi:hypothetical protein
VKIQDVQNDAMAKGTAVHLEGVIVTAIDSFGTKIGDFWVEEPGGGPFSGVHVYGGPAASVAALVLGDVVTIDGAQKDEFALASDTTGRTLTELKPVTGGAMTVTKTGSAAVPTPDVVDALAIGQMTDPARSAEWEKWEGVLITVKNVAALSKPKCIGAACADPTLQSFGITGVAKAESALASFPTTIARNLCLASVTGVGDYFFDYLVYPRTTDEVVTGGTSCPAPESTATLCGDAIDNDANGFSDCADNNCIIGVNTCRATSTVNALDVATTLPTGGLELGSTESLYVTAISANGADFWVSTGPGAAMANQGIYVFAAGTTLPSGIVVGSKVDVIGTAQAYNNDTTGNALLEFNELQVSALTGTGSVTPATDAVNVTAAKLTVDATGKQWVGSLVHLTNVAVVTVGTTANHGVGSLKQAGVTFESLPDIIGMTGLPAAEMSKCYASIDGIWTYDVYSNAYGLVPLAVGTGTGTCN